VILLIDERLTQSRYTRLFPPEWRHFQVVRPHADLKEKLRHFWQKNIKT
jgi:DNA excision repair protein ERCC-2